MRIRRLPLFLALITMACVQSTQDAFGQLVVHTEKGSAALTMPRPPHRAYQAMVDTTDLYGVNYVNGVIASNRGVWIGTMGGLLLVDHELTLKEHFDISTGLPGGTTSYLEKGLRGGIWSSSGSRVGRYKNGRWTRFSLVTKKEGLHEIHAGKDGSIYMRVWKSWDKEKDPEPPPDEIRVIAGNEVSTIALPPDNQLAFETVAANQDGVLWYIQGTDIFQKTDEGWENISTSIPGKGRFDMASSAMVDHKGTLWVAMGDYIVRYDGREFSWIRSPEIKGSASSGLHLHEDHTGRIWSQRSNALYYLNRKTERWISLPLRHAKEAEIRSFDVWNDTIYIGSWDGLYVLRTTLPD